jgi:hypothetical protein
MSDKQFDVTWHDSGQWPRVAPDPEYPAGIDLDVSAGARITCTVSLPYPAKRIGRYVVACRVCGLRIACTTAGRPDDPRSIKLPCQTVATA